MAGSAHAVVVCDNCTYVAPATYLGLHNPGDSSSFNSGTATSSQFYVFNLSATSVVRVSAIFSPAVNNNMTLFSGLGGSCAEAGGACTGLTLGSQIASGSFSAGGSVGAISPITALPGRYVLVVMGSIVGNLPRSEFDTTLLAGGASLGVQPVPEPAAWALMLGGLVGVTAWRRRQKAA